VESPRWTTWLHDVVVGGGGSVVVVEVLVVVVGVVVLVGTISLDVGGIVNGIDATVVEAIGMVVPAPISTLETSVLQPTPSTTSTMIATRLIGPS
jgi:hypothetical protein